MLRSLNYFISMDMVTKNAKINVYHIIILILHVISSFSPQI